MERSRYTGLHWQNVRSTDFSGSSLCKTYVENPRCTQIAPENFRWVENHADVPCVFGMERRPNGGNAARPVQFCGQRTEIHRFLPKFTILHDSNAAEFAAPRRFRRLHGIVLCTVALPRYSAVLLKL